MAEYEIDGKDFATLEEFYDEISRVLIPTHGGAGTWARSTTSSARDEVAAMSPVKSTERRRRPRPWPS